MPADKVKTLFGPRNDPEVQEGLPLYIGSCESTPLFNFEIVVRLIQVTMVQRTRDALFRYFRQECLVQRDGIGFGRPRPLSTAFV